MCLNLENTQQMLAQAHSKQLLKFILGSHIDPTGDQNDVQYVFQDFVIYCVYLLYLLLYVHM